MCCVVFVLLCLCLCVVFVCCVADIVDEESSKLYEESEKPPKLWGRALCVGCTVFIFAYGQLISSLSQLSPLSPSHLSSLLPLISLIISSLIISSLIISDQ